MISVELRIVCEGGCICGTPTPISHEARCNHNVECDWGAFDDPPLFTFHPETGEVTATEVNPLILISRTFADNHGSCPVDEAQTKIVTFHDDGRRFMRITADNGTWTWELFDAHWEDGLDCNLYIGRWPD